MKNRIKDADKSAGLVLDLFELALQRSPEWVYIAFNQTIKTGDIMRMLILSGSDQTSVRVRQIFNYLHGESLTQANFEVMTSRMMERRP